MYELPIGVIVALEEVLNSGTSKMEEMGIYTCQLNCWNPMLLTQENAIKLKEILKNKFFVPSIWVGWPGPAVWDFIDGPLTLGLVPREYRNIRIECLKKGADFALALGVPNIITHVGFIPENPATTEYREVVIAVREIAQYCKKRNICFNFETGQETPITLVRTIEDVGLDNLGINLDPANLLMYGKGNPMDAVDIYKSWIRGVHVKDGFYPTNGRELGKEVPVGEGLVDFRTLLRKLKNYKFNGALIIEREISGEQQKKDIIKAKGFLETLLEEL